MTRAHGSLRGLRWVDRSRLTEGRFGRMFRWLPGETYKDEDLSSLASQMIQLESADLRDQTNPETPHVPKGELFKDGPDIILKSVEPPKRLDTAFGEPEAGDENPTIPAGYTYFGQYIDHDLTFDPNSSLQKQNDPDALVDFRTPRLDLDSLYGRGPDDQPYLYDDRDGIHFALGRHTDDPKRVRLGELQRNADGRALIGDPRNDENSIICQLQAVFLNFHNKVIDELQAKRKSLKPHEIFLEAQRIVRWHYQYIVLNDYLPRIVGDCTWKHVYLGGENEARAPRPHLEFYKPKSGEAYMPVEFSVAAFRFGHSMVRPSYALRRDDANVGGASEGGFAGDRRFNRIPIFSDLRDPERTANLSGFGRLPPDWEIDWQLFFSAGPLPTEIATDGEDPGALQVKPGTITQPGYRIDTKLVDPLAMLPPTVAKSGNMPDGVPVLAYRNLIRGSTFELPSGQNVARALGVKPLSEQDLWDDSPNARFRDPESNPFAFRAPLWFYILKEAEQVRQHGLNDTKGGHHLGDVGGRIVAEVLVGIALSDHTSYLYQDAGWKPELEKYKSGFDAGRPLKTMFQLIAWTTNDSMTFR